MSQPKETDSLPPIFPVPPPPPPPPVNSSSQSKVTLKTFKSEKDELNIALERMLYRDKTLKKVLVIHNTNTKPQLQYGPKCGLVALSIASSTTPKSINADDIFITAFSKGFSKQGEIFDVEFLAYLAENCCEFKANVIKDGLSSHLKCIIQNLLNNNLILVPYDSDHNYSPCCKQGFKAHWAVISGFVIFQLYDENTNSDADDNDYEGILLQTKDVSTFCKCSDSNSKCDKNPVYNLILPTSEQKVIISKNNQTKIGHCKKLVNGKIYLIGRQGKSEHLGIWSFDDMADSNNNLLFFSNDRKADDYVLPKEGIDKGLKGKAIILKQISSTV